MTAPTAEAAGSDPRLEADLDALLDLDPESRAAALAAIATTRPSDAARLERWLAAIEASSGRFGEPSPQPLPDRIGAWRIGRRIGRGGIGDVYAGERADGAFERRVAIKLLRIDRDADWIIEGERRLLARLQHPNIATLLDGGILADGRPWLVTEFVDGIALDAWLAAVPDLARRLRVFDALCDAVAYAHAAGVVHADLKPDNVLVTAGDVPKLLDFGIARWVRESGDGARWLTPLWAAPEQFEGEPARVETDVQGLGLLLYRMLTGRLPECLDGRDLAQIRARRLASERALPAAIETGPSGEPIAQGEVIAAILRRSLARAPEDRHRSVDALRADVNAWRRTAFADPDRPRPTIARRPLDARAIVGWVIAVALLGVIAALAVALDEIGRQRDEALALALSAADALPTVDPVARVPAAGIRGDAAHALLDLLAARSPLSPAAQRIALRLGLGLVAREDFVGARRALALVDAAGPIDAGASSRVEREILRAGIAVAERDDETAFRAIEAAFAALGEDPPPRMLVRLDARRHAAAGDVEAALAILDRLAGETPVGPEPRHADAAGRVALRIELARLGGDPALARREGARWLAETRLSPTSELRDAIATEVALAEIDLAGSGGANAEEPLTIAAQTLGDVLARAHARGDRSGLIALAALEGLARIAAIRGDAERRTKILGELLALETERFGPDSFRTAARRRELERAGDAGRPRGG